MTITERNIKLKHFITCLKCEIHGRECDDNCPTQYEAGNMGEIIENLEEISKALDQQPSKDCISRQAAIDAVFSLCEDCDSGYCGSCRVNYPGEKDVIKVIRNLPSAQTEERKESLCKKVRALCEESKIEFFFVGGGESTWSVTNDKHIKKIVECHKAQLSQEDTTKDATSDTISRQAAIDALQGRK